jgi:circadian clock protein KaiC
MADEAQFVTAVPGLDRLLCGGLRPGGMYLVAGDPGAGKTVLAHQTGAHHAAGGGSILYLTALVESHQTLLSQMRSFSFFNPSIVPNAFYYASVAPALESGGLNGVRQEIARLLLSREPDLVILDGLHTLKVMADSAAEYQRLLTFLQAQCASTGVTMLVIANREAQDAADPMYTVSDGILVLETEQSNRRRIRTLEVRKLRGRQHLTGSHVMEITGDGVRVYPRVEALAANLKPPFEPPLPAHAAFGIEGVDAMIDDGFGSNSVTLIPGPSGVGKTLFGLSFLTAGAEAGENVLFLGFHETPDRLLAKADSIGLTLRPHVAAGRADIRWHAAADLAVDRIAQGVLDDVERNDIRRVVIDSMDELRHGLSRPGRTLPFLSAFTQLLRGHGTAVLLTSEASDSDGLRVTAPLPEISAAVDNIVVLRYLQAGAQLHRAMSILKVRDQAHDELLREYTISAKGITVGGRLDPTGLPDTVSYAPASGDTE